MTMYNGNTPGLRLDGDPILRIPCKEVTQFDKHLKDLVKDMKQIMKDSGGIGIAAPQVGASYRVVYIDIPDEFTGVLVNPKILEESEKTDCVPEGCLSFPGLVRNVIRPIFVEIKYQTIKGGKQKLLATGLLAQCILHEIDHLNGVLLVDHEEVDPVQYNLSRFGPYYKR